MKILTIFRKFSSDMGVVWWKGTVGLFGAERGDIRGVRLDARHRGLITGDTELPFCPENREYLGLFIDLIIKISGQKGNFFEIFQIFLYL